MARAHVARRLIDAGSSTPPRTWLFPHAYYNRFAVAYRRAEIVASQHHARYAMVNECLTNGDGVRIVRRAYVRTDGIITIPAGHFGIELFQQPRLRHKSG